ncbi:hypothetical protein BAY59_11575 [Prauserella coralliicola]|nr:hypothetical protein BAY59_11575 [Prauserella coralliicola]
MDLARGAPAGLIGQLRVALSDQDSRREPGLAPTASSSWDIAVHVHLPFYGELTEKRLSRLRAA